MSSILAKLAIFALIVALIVNTVVHFYYTPYRSYEQNFAIIKQQVKAHADWNMQQMREMYIPNLTNSFETIVKKYFYSNFSISGTNDYEIQKKEQKEKINQMEINARYFEVSGKPYFVFSRKNFSVGDSFRGASIVYIDKTCFFTNDGQKYFFVFEKSSIGDRIITNKGINDE